MRPALIAQALLLTPALAACGTAGGDAAGPERRSAAGEVLGGEVTDAMVPLDSVRSTAPAAPRAPASGDATDGPAADPVGDRRAILPRPEVSGGPEPLPSDPSAEDAPSPPQL